MGGRDLTPSLGDDIRHAGDWDLQDSDLDVQNSPAAVVDHAKSGRQNHQEGIKSLSRWFE